MRACVASTLCAAALLTAEVTAQSRPVFAGEWVIDAGAVSVSGGGRGDRQGRASGGGGGMGGGTGLGAPAPRLAISQDSSKLRVEERFDDGTTVTINYRLDGRPVRNTMRMGRNRTLDASHASRWRGASLVTTIEATVANARGSTPVEYRETRSLENDSTMVVELAFAGRGAGRRVTYRRVQ